MRILQRPTFVPPLDIALAGARQVHADAERADIHDHDAIVESHAAATEALRQLLAALDAEEGRP
ncbi:hypothetical protein [Streptomyces sp. NPDC018031]|uniref:hypothetical protein n=1 Tax=Streptomyces sp. NPDC018031 TaxID=3365033 RepID=UPI003788B89C